jgi:quinoprotein glucose dehydrogenase
MDGVDLREASGATGKTIGRIQSNTPGKIFEHLVILGSATESAFSPPGDLRATTSSQESWCGSFTPCPIRENLGAHTWPKDAWKHRWDEYVGRNHDRRPARHRVLSDRLGDL